MPPEHSRNLALIGMPGAGKSTVGVLLAKAMGRLFIDTDIYIQAIENRPLRAIIDEVGLEKFCRMEEEHILCIDAVGAVIATGGSVVYSPRLMQHFRETATIVHLDLDLEVIRTRLGDLEARGVVIRKDQTIDELYAERMPLYRKYADVTISCLGKNHQQVLTDILSAVK
ncbi:MAG TPA: shikimate kinase [Sedimentisphaerales bacterium]|nr:shikimate kinase [Sedimentisphaerales bacterium]